MSIDESRPRAARSLPTPAWHGRVAVVSPHLDDAILSLGASIHAAARRGAQVDVLTVLAGDPDSAAPPDDSARRAGFESVGDAARLRREEDRIACRLVGAHPRWLPLSDLAGAKASPEEVRAHVRPALERYNAVLVPGSPLRHADHRLVSLAVLDVLSAGVAVGIYLEQPYASWDAFALNGRPRQGRSAATALRTLNLDVDGEPAWRHHAGRPKDWKVKVRSMSAYVSQLRVLRRAPRTRILVYEALHRGESVLWLRLG